MMRDVDEIIEDHGLTLDNSRLKKRIRKRLNAQCVGLGHDLPTSW